MESWWIWVGAAVALSLFLTVPIRVGFRVHSNNEGVRVHAALPLRRPLAGERTYPVAWILQKAVPIAKAAVPKGRR